MTKLSTIAALLEEPFTGKLNVDKNETVQDVKDRYQKSIKYDRLTMEVKLSRLLKQHRASVVAIGAAKKSSAPEDKKQPHLQKAFQNLEEMLVLSVAMTRQLEMEQAALKQMMSKAPDQTDPTPTPPEDQKVE
jgi:hypothetical protein